MRQKVSVTIAEETVRELEEVLKNGWFRNKSHLIEFAIKQFLEGKNEKP